jgi:hypothetical protein
MDKDSPKPSPKAPPKAASPHADASHLTHKAGVFYYRRALPTTFTGAATSHCRWAHEPLERLNT